jgi:hypothetical protein
MFRATTANDVEFSMTVVMPLKKWVELCDVIEDKWPGWEMRAAISQMVREADRVYRAEHEVTR